MRKIILQLAVSLDNFIEGHNGEIDWCLTDQDYGMKDFLNRIDTMFIGRKSYELLQSMGEDAMPGFPKLKEYVFSNSLSELKPGATVVKGNIGEEVNKIKNEHGKDIWLFGGASLTTTFLNQNLIDEIILAIHPVILGAGKTLFQDINGRKQLKLLHTTTYDTGLLMVSYEVEK